MLPSPKLSCSWQHSQQHLVAFHDGRNNWSLKNSQSPLIATRRPFLLRGVPLTSRSHWMPSCLHASSHDDCPQPTSRFWWYISALETLPKPNWGRGGVWGSKRALQQVRKRALQEEFACRFGVLLVGQFQSALFQLGLGAVKRVKVLGSACELDEHHCRDI